MSDLDVWGLRQKGLPYKEIAETLGISERRARWAVHDVKKELAATAEKVTPEAVADWGEKFEALGRKTFGLSAREDAATLPFRSSNKPVKHMFIPDTQCAPGDDLEHLRWAGEYAAEQEPDVIIHAGDHWHMDSLSSYEKPGSKFFEGKRYVDDIAAGNKGLELFEEGLTRRSRAEYKPRKVLLRGNHENRVTRAIETEPRMEGAIGFHHFNDVQLGWEVHDFLELVEISGIYYCFTPDHKILTKDLNYVPLGDIEIGTEIVGFDEHSNNGVPRQYKTATVLAKDFSKEIVYSVHLGNGDILKCTGDHLWLARPFGTTAWRWVKTNSLLRVRHEVCKPFPLWDRDLSWESGWIAGMLDGEGHISKSNSNQGGIQLGLAQKKGPTLDQVHSILTMMGVVYNTHTSSNCETVRILGPSGDKLKLIGRTRANRLIQKFSPERLGRLQHAGPVISVIDVVEIGRKEIVQIATSSQTMVIDGYAQHNCHYFYLRNSGRAYTGSMDSRLKNVGHSFSQGHQQGLMWGRRELGNGQAHCGLVAGSFYQKNENYRGPQANNEWRGIIMKHEVRDGQYDPMMVSMNYLSREFKK